MLIFKNIKRIFFNKIVARLLILLILKLHNLTYKLAAVFSSILNNNIHPKHAILNYQQWFTDNVSEEDVILDIGCNNGTMVGMLADKAQYVYGIEINKSLYSQAKLKIKKSNVEFICFDATIYDYSSCIDLTVVTLSNVLEHIDDRVSFLNNIVKKIPWGNKLNKKILIRVPMIDRDWITIYKKQIGVEYRLDRTHYTEYSYQQFKDELSKCNIEILSHHIQFGELYAVCKAI
jgi:SAM-dependent methyltransferase